jgi:hypothetical protein
MLLLLHEEKLAPRNKRAMKSGNDDDVIFSFLFFFGGVRAL